MVKALTTMCFVSVACLGQGLIRFDNFNIPTHSDPSRVYYAPIYREDFFTAARAGGAGGGLIAGLVLADSNEVIATSLFNTDSAHSPYLAEGKVVAIPGYSAGSRPTLRFRVWEWAEGWTNSRVRFETSFQTQPLGGQTQDGTSVQIPGLTGFGSEDGSGFVILNWLWFSNELDCRDFRLYTLQQNSILQVSWPGCVSNVYKLQLKADVGSWIDISPQLKGDEYFTGFNVIMTNGASVNLLRTVNVQ